jgi:hypothetical protein
MLDRLPRDRPGTTLILLEDYTQRRLDVDDFDSRAIVSEQIDPALARLAYGVRGVEGEVAPRP